AGSAAADENVEEPIAVVIGPLSFAGGDAREREAQLGKCAVAVVVIDAQSITIGGIVTGHEGIEQPILVVIAPGDGWVIEAGEVSEGGESAITVVVEN